VKGRPREGMSFPRMLSYQAYSSKDRAFTDDHGSQDPVHPLQEDTLLENRTTLLGTIMPETRKISLEIHKHVTTAVARITSSEIVTRRKTWYRILAAWFKKTLTERSRSYMSCAYKPKTQYSTIQMMPSKHFSQNQTSLIQMTRPVIKLHKTFTANYPRLWKTLSQDLKVSLNEWIHRISRGRQCTPSMFDAPKKHKHRNCPPKEKVQV